MTRIPARIGGGVCLAVLLAGAVAPALAADDAALTVADLAAYRAALSGQRRAQEPPAVVGFRELWDHPATYQGRRVQVQGRLVRRFRQGSFGTFPPLEEAWVFSPAGDPFCLVFPAPRDPEEREAETKTKTPGAAGSVRFAGTFLKLLEYQGADGPRRAPLIVGPAPPVAVTVALEPAQAADAGRGAAPDVARLDNRPGSGGGGGTGPGASASAAADQAAPGQERLDRVGTRLRRRPRTASLGAAVEG